MSKIKISRQRKYQILHKQKGLCLQCSNIAVKSGRCESCYEKNKIIAREYMRKRYLYKKTHGMCQNCDKPIFKASFCEIHYKRNKKYAFLYRSQRT